MHSNRPKITLTGLDEKTNLSEVSSIKAELAFLFSAKGPASGLRYPRREWIVDAVKVIPNAAVHICGRGARQLLMARDLDDILSTVARIQINGPVSNEELVYLERLYPNKELIVQYYPGNAPLILADNRASFLVDSSGGTGVLPDEWLRPVTPKSVGFAGGLSPSNMLAELPKILKVAEGNWWVDMESRLRENDVFSLNLARDAVNVFHAVLDSVSSPT